MINISLSPILVLFMCIVFLITGIYCLKCVLFYHENKDKLNNFEENKISLDEFKRHQHNLEWFKDYVSTDERVKNFTTPKEGKNV